MGVRIVLIGILLAVVACQLAEPTPSPPLNPGASRIESVGWVASIAASSGAIRFVLEDGRDIEVDPSVSRQIHDGAGDRLLLVSARDPRGPWFAVIGTQVGLPNDCLVLNERGTDWGAHIEIAGVAWTKAPEFRYSPDAVALGARYPEGTRFCLNDDARVTSAFRS
jgi:hypothetical protein